MGVGLRPIERSVDLPPNPKVARAEFLSRLRGVLRIRHSYRDLYSLGFMLMVNNIQLSLEKSNTIYWGAFKLDSDKKNSEL